MKLRMSLEGSDWTSRLPKISDKTMVGKRLNLVATNLL